MQRYRFVIEPDQRRRAQFIAAALFAVTLLVAGPVVAFRSGPSKLVSASTGSTSITTSRVADSAVASTSTSAARRATTSSQVATTTTTTETSIKPADSAKESTCAHTTGATATPEADEWVTDWQTAPGANEPLMLLVCIDDVTPAVGQTVNVSVVAGDKDATIGTGECDVKVDWEGNAGSLCRDTVVVTRGPQPTPPREPGRVQVTYQHTYSRTGDALIDVSVWSGPADGKRYPYNSYNSVELPITVHR